MTSTDSKSTASSDAAGSKPRVKELAWSEISIVKQVCPDIALAQDCSHRAQNLASLFASPQVGKGSYGVVFTAEWRGSLVVVKKLLDQSLSEAQLEEFMRECELFERIGRQ